MRRAAWVSSRLVAGGDWALRFDPLPGVKFNAVVKGACWIVVEGVEPQRLASGDSFLLQGRSFVLVSDPAVLPVDAGPVFQQAQNGVARYGDGEDVELIGGRLDLREAEAALLLAGLPSFVRFDGASEAAAGIGWMLRRLEDELRSERPGTALLRTGLMQMMFVEAFRMLQMFGATPGGGWLTALADPRLGRTLSLIHGDPARSWTVEALADTAAMSRSSYARAFRTRVGMPPLAYVAHWRMQKAAYALRNSDEPVGRIGLSLGCESEGGFSTAFSRTLGRSPSAYRREHRAVSPSG